jgi:hypothetical protein
MERVHRANERTFSQVRHLAVAIRSIAPDQRHMGLLHYDGGGVRLLHLRWHHVLSNEPASDAYIWVDPAINSQRLRQVAAICRRVWESNQTGIPYAFSAPNDCFDVDTGQFLLGETRLGLTCSSFVLAVFHAAGLQLVDYDSWPTDRSDDQHWQTAIIKSLIETGAAEQHINAVRKEIGAVRFRPEEVAGAATLSSLPANFQQASAVGKMIVSQLGRST